MTQKYISQVPQTQLQPKIDKQPSTLDYIVVGLIFSGILLAVFSGEIYNSLFYLDKLYNNLKYYNTYNPWNLYHDHYPKLQKIIEELKPGEFGSAKHQKALFLRDYLDQMVSNPNRDTGKISKFAWRHSQENKVFYFTRIINFPDDKMVKIKIDSKIIYHLNNVPKSIENTPREIAMHFFFNYFLEEDQDGTTNIFQLYPLERELIDLLVNVTKGKETGLNIHYYYSEAGICHIFTLDHDRA